MRDRVRDGTLSIQDLKDILRSVAVRNLLILSRHVREYFQMQQEVGLCIPWGALSNFCLDSIDSLP